MINKIKTITDKSVFHSILNEYFMGGKSYVKSNSGNIQVKFLNCSGGLAAVRIPFNVNPPQNSLMFTRNKSNIIYAYMKFWEARDADTFIFNPEKIQVMTAVRKYKRRDVGASEEKKPVCATNIITEPMIRNSLSSGKDTINKIKDKIIGDYKKDYDYIKLFFSGDDPDDLRMRCIRERRSSIFVRYISNNPADGSDPQFEYYMNTIYCSCTDFMKSNDFVSEITVPLMCNSRIPYGYIQVNGKSPYTYGTFVDVKKIEIQAEQLAADLKLFSPIDGSAGVTDVSARGLGIIFTEKAHVPCYKEKSLVVLDLIFPDDARVAMLASVRHLEMLEDKSIKAGLEIIYMGRAEQTNYENFLKTKKPVKLQQVISKIS